MDDDSYDLVPHREVTELKKQLQESKSKADKISSQDLLDSMNSLTKTMNSMLQLFSKTAEELKVEEKAGSTADKLDSMENKIEEVMDQNRTIAEGMVAISDMINDLVEKVKAMPKSRVKDEFPAGLQSQNFESSFQQPPSLGPSTEGPTQGPVPMPTMPFLDLEDKSKKKGLFGRLKK